MNNKGITLVTVVVMIIVIIIIATVSIVSGTRLISNSKTLTDGQNIESIREAVQRRNSEMQMQGTITPIDEVYPGQLSPKITPDSIECTNWYLLNDDSLSELGIKASQGKYLVNYQKGIVLSLEDVSYAESYLMYRFIDSVVTAKAEGNLTEYVGEALSDYSLNGSGKVYYQVLEYDAKEVYGTGWYRVNPTHVINQLGEEFEDINLETYVKNDYLVNYDDYKIVKFTSKLMEG